MCARVCARVCVCSCVRVCLLVRSLDEAVLHLPGGIEPIAEAGADGEEPPQAAAKFIQKKQSVKVRKGRTCRRLSSLAAVSRALPRHRATFISPSISLVVLNRLWILILYSSLLSLSLNHSSLLSIWFCLSLSHTHTHAHTRIPCPKRSFWFALSTNPCFMTVCLSSAVVNGFSLMGLTCVRVCVGCAHLWLIHTGVTTN